MKLNDRARLHEYRFPRARVSGTTAQRFHLRCYLASWRATLFREGTYEDYRAASYRRVDQENIAPRPVFHSIRTFSENESSRSYATRSDVASFSCFVLFSLLPPRFIDRRMIQPIQPMTTLAIKAAINGCQFPGTCSGEAGDRSGVDRVYFAVMFDDFWYLIREDKHHFPSRGIDVAQSRVTLASTSARSS